MLCETRSIEDLWKVLDDFKTISGFVCSASGPQSGMSITGMCSETYSLANFSCSSTEAKSKKPQVFDGFSTSFPQ